MGSKSFFKSVLQPRHTIRLKRDRASGPLETSIEWCGLTDNGKVRDHNEDNISCIDLREGNLFIIADGMGGHDAGEVASKLAVDTVAREILNGSNGKYDPEKLLENAVQTANTEVLREAIQKGSNMGTTLTAALVMHDMAYIANVGDSRTYWIENSSIRQITQDHSLVQKLVSTGKLSREEARTHPNSNVLYRNIGSEENVKVDIFPVTLRKGGSLLLCTDGLWGEVTDAAMQFLFAVEHDVRKVCAGLIRLANDNGGKDNITAMVVKVV